MTEYFLVLATAFNMALPILVAGRSAINSKSLFIFIYFAARLTEQYSQASAHALTLCATLFQHFVNIQNPKILPTTPTLFLAHCKAHKADTQKPTLQRAKNANAQPNHPSGRNSYRLQLNTSANNYTQHQSPPTTQQMKMNHFN